MRYDFYVRSREDLIEAIRTFGIVPYFSNAIPGFSLEERCDPRILWSDDGNDAWSWKGPVIRETHCAYGKFFFKKAAYVSEDVFLDLANYRRDGYDFDARYDDGLARHEDLSLYELITANAPVTSKELRRIGGYAYSGRGKKVEGRKGFDSGIARLQELCYVVISDFIYSLDRRGLPTGWGVAAYTTPEQWFAPDFSERVYARSPEESYERLLARLRAYFPDAGEKDLKRILK